MPRLAHPRRRLAHPEHTRSGPPPSPPRHSRAPRPIPRRDASLLHHRAKGGREPAAQTGRSDKGQVVRQTHEVVVRMGKRDEFGERTPRREARLKIVVANLRVARGTLRARAATYRKWNRHPVVRTPASDAAAHRLDHPASSWPGTWGNRMSGSRPCHPCQSLRQMPLAFTRTTTPSCGGVGSGTRRSSSVPGIARR